MTEAQLKERVLTLAHAAGWRVYHRPARYQRNGGGSGYPDLTLARHGDVLWLELKADKGVLSGEQSAWLQAFPKGNTALVFPEDVSKPWFLSLLAMGPRGALG